MVSAVTYVLLEFSPGSGVSSPPTRKILKVGDSANTPTNLGPDSNQSEMIEILIEMSIHHTLNLLLFPFAFITCLKLLVIPG